MTTNNGRDPWLGSFKHCRELVQRAADSSLFIRFGRPSAVSTRGQYGRWDWYIFLPREDGFLVFDTMPLNDKGVTGEAYILGSVGTVRMSSSGVDFLARESDQAGLRMPDNSVVRLSDTRVAGEVELDDMKVWLSEILEADMAHAVNTAIVGRREPTPEELEAKRLADEADWEEMSRIMESMQ